MNQKHYFASANTGANFVNYFQNILKDGFTYVIKGGSGTGKSHLMKTIGNHFLKKGFSVEFYHCSSDIESLDGVKIVEKNVLIVDGTFPHIQDVSCPMVNGKILDVGQFVSPKIKKYKNEIECIVKNKKKAYEDFYGYLKCLNDLQKIEEKNHKNFENSVFFEENEKIIKKYDLKKQNKTSNVREFFMEAVQEDGVKTLLGYNDFCKHKIKKDIFCASQQLNLLKEKLCEFGYDVVVIKNNLMPHLVAGLIVEEKNLCVLNDVQKILEEHFLQHDEIAKKLLILSFKSLKTAKELHQKLEKFYIENMNFKEEEKLTKKVIVEIEKNF